MAAPISPFQRTYPAVPDAVPAARSAIAAFAVDAGASPELIEDVRLAASEALTNAVVHAYRSAHEPGAIAVTAALAADELWVIVADSGCGLRPRDDSPGLGLGMALMMQLAADIDVHDRSDGGTEVTLRFVLEPEPVRVGRQSRGSCDSAIRPASSSFSMTR